MFKKVQLLAISLLLEIISYSQSHEIESTLFYDSLAASDTLNWPQMQYLDSVMEHGAWSTEHSDNLLELGIIKDVQEKAKQAPEHIKKLDSLLQEKSRLLQEKIQNLSSKIQDTADSSGQLLPFDINLYTSKMESIDGLIEQYSAELTNSKERSWLQNHLSQLQQMDGALGQYQGELLDIEELNQVRGYQQKLQELTGLSQEYLQQVMSLKRGINKETLLSEEGGLMQKLKSLIGNRPEFQELQAQTAELEQFKQLADKFGEDYARQHTQEAQQRLISKAKEIGAGAFAEHQDKVQQVQEETQKLKKKYSSVADARDLSTAVKRNSLKGEPLGKRLVLGGTFQIIPSFSRKDSVGGLPQNYSTSLDLSPIVGYRLNKKFTLGSSLTYRANIVVDDLETQNETYGYRGFLEYYLKESIFLHGEYQAMSTDVIKQDTNIEDPSRQWVYGALIGLGKEFALFKGFKGQVILLYDFLYDGTVSPYKRPVSIRFGLVK